MKKVKSTTNTKKFDRAFNISIKENTQTGGLSWVVDEQDSTSYTRLEYSTITTEEYNASMDDIAKIVWNLPGKKSSDQWE